MYNSEVFIKAYKDSFFKELSFFKDSFDFITLMARGIGKELGLKPIYYHLHFLENENQLYTSVFSDTDYYHLPTLAMDKFFSQDSPTKHQLEFIVTTTSLLFKYKGGVYALTDIYNNPDLTLSQGKLRLLRQNFNLSSCDNTPNFTEEYLNPVETLDLIQYLYRIYAYIKDGFNREWLGHVSKINKKF